MVLDGCHVETCGQVVVWDEAVAATIRTIGIFQFISFLRRWDDKDRCIKLHTSTGRSFAVPVPVPAAPEFLQQVW